VTIQTDKFIAGFGKVDIIIKARYAETWTGTALVLGPFVLKVKET
jgi:hypothetical protein